MAITGEVQWGDLLEKVTFNALPATFSPDMWTHQYVQQVNQPQCSLQEDPVYYTNPGDSALFGLEPNFGCCTSNLSQAWPKLASSAVMRSDKGLVASVYVPSTVCTDINGANVTFDIETNYPFRNIVKFVVKTDRPSTFDIMLRIPEWCSNACVEIDGIKYDVNSGEFYTINRQWQGEVSFTLTLPMKTKLLERPNNLYTVTHGPLVYSLAIDEKWVQINKDIEGHEYPHCDYEVFPISEWNYGLKLDKDNYQDKINFIENPMGKCPFSPEGAPISATIKGKKIEWCEKDGVPSAVPEMSWISDEVDEIKLIPFGCTNLRITEMPLVK